MRIVIEFICEFTSLFVLVFLMSHLWQSSLLGVILSVPLLVYIFCLNKEQIRPAGIFILVVFLLFLIGEMIMVNSGAWKYSNPTWWSMVPGWIGLSWVWVALILKELYSTIEKTVAHFERR